MSQVFKRLPSSKAKRLNQRKRKANLGPNQAKKHGKIILRQNNYERTS